MNRSTCAFVCLIVGLSTHAVFAESSADESVQASTSPVAYVYVQTLNGIDLYDASSAGKLTEVKGSPFKASGPGQTMIGSDGKYFIMLGANDLHSYSLASNGAIKEQASQIDTQNYSGSYCAAGDYANSPRAAELYGPYIYVLLGGSYSGDGHACTAYQSYQVSNTGLLEFKGSLDAGDVDTGLPSITGNGKFAYSATSIEDTGNPTGFGEFSRESSGALGGNGGPVTEPKSDTDNGYGPCFLAADATNHLAVSVDTDGVCGNAQLASFTVGSNGSLTSTNSWENMPTLRDGIGGLSISPSGKILAAATGAGVQFFHFNGAKPITTFTGIIGLSGYITQMAWDRSNHLYAINGATGKVHIYTVTTKSAAETPGSPYAIGATDLVVVPK